MPKIMNARIDIKSSMLGLGAGVLVALVVAAVSSSGDSLGRYQLVATGQSGGGSECFIIDTMNGKVWRASVAPNCRTDADFFQRKNGEK